MGVHSPSLANGAKAPNPAMAGSSSSLAAASPALVRQARVALLSTWHPEPVDNGRKQRTRMIIDALSPDVEIVLISLVDDPATDGRPLPTVPAVVAAYALRLPTFESHSLRGLKGALSTRPRSVGATWDADTSRRINRIVSSHQAGIAIGTDMRTLQYLTALPAGVKRILDEPDVSPFLARDFGASASRIRAALRERKYRAWLRREVPGLDAVVVASDPESKAVECLTGLGTTIIENGIPFVPEHPWAPSDSSTLLFTGSITYEPNLEAVTYLLDRVLPAVHLWEPGALLRVTGNLPQRLPREVQRGKVEFTGRLSSVDHLYRGARVFVAPLLSGTGTRIKLLEAMSYGMPIVSTSKGAEGLPVVDGEHLLIADDAASFACAVVRLLSDPELCLRLGGAARSLVAERFAGPIVQESWRAVVAAVLAETVGDAANG
jgi:glycosyltransferase involved in cell wall biosynthesis